MKGLELSKFDGGLDLRESATTAPADTFRLLDDCFVTGGGRRLTKRAGIEDWSGFSPHSRGLALIGTKFVTFTHYTTRFAYGRDIQEITLARQDNAPLLGVLYAAEFQRGLYVVAVHQAPVPNTDPPRTRPETLHFWVKPDVLDGKDTWRYVADENCPQSSVVTIAASKIFAVDPKFPGVVRFSATLNPFDWTTSEDAGFIDCGGQRSGSKNVIALDIYREYLAVFFEDGLQLWTVDPNPKLMRLVRQVDAAGAAFTGCTVSSSGDLYYLSQKGVRSVTTAAGNEQQYEYDVGSPVDALIPLVLAAIDATPSPSPIPASGQPAYYDSDPIPTPGTPGDPPEPSESTRPNDPFPDPPPPAQPDYMPRLLAVAEPQAGRAWFFFGRVALVHTLQRASKISCWCRIRFPGRVRAAIARPDGMYLLFAGSGNGQRVGRIGSNFGADRTGDDVDSPVSVVMRARWPYLNAKMPGVSKRLDSLDAVAEGPNAGEVRVLYDPSQAGDPDDPTVPDAAGTPWEELYADRREELLQPLEVSAVSFALDVRHSATGPFQVDLLEVLMRGQGRRRP